MKKVCCLFFLFVVFSSLAQTPSKNFRKKTIKVVRDTIQVDSISISPYNFKVFDDNKKPIDSVNYTIDFSKALLVLNSNSFSEITVEYNALPEFLTKSYSLFDKSIIVPKRTNTSRLYSAKPTKNNSFFKPFDGLNTSGSISRGFTVGNNQDAVLNSNLDLQISGYLSNKVQLRASITDTNIPLQDGGYTQRLNEFDRVFIELFSDNWSIKAGDVNLQNTTSNFLRFNKKVAGVDINATLNHSNSKTNAYASGAIVRGQFARNTIVAQEANQGPYLITGNASDQLLLIISGSETVYVNGAPLRRGENYDYIINYNTAEITFNPTYPVNANMRIIVEYQLADRNYTRFVTYNGAQYDSEKFKIGFNFYNENDAKNQTNQQDLTDSQRQILAEAGDDLAKMVVPSAIPQTFSENAILYKKELINGIETFVFSNDENDDLFSVRFSFVGANQGNYRIQSTVATGRIYEYIAPINGILQGDYEPIVQLVAPDKLQIATLNAEYIPSDKTQIQTEIAYSNNDLNLFSSLDDNNNNGFAAKVNWNQLLIDKPWQLRTTIGFETIDQDFRTIERFRNIEFNRDWDLVNPLGNQQFLKASIAYQNKEKGIVSYAFENLRFSENFNGLRHNILSNLQLNKTAINISGSFLSNDNELTETEFLRWYSTIKQHFKRNWIGIKFNAEENDRRESITNIPSALNHKFVEYEAFAGVGDTTKVHAEFGYNYRTTDSVRVNQWQRINNTNTYFLRSRLIQSKSADLDVFASYRTVDNKNAPNEEALNSRLIYRQQLFNNGISFNTVYETNSGTLPQQEFNYVEVEPGQGFYRWIDYNENGIQELDEFEIAQFPDEAIYVRVALPTTQFIKTHQNKFSQALTLNASQWRAKEGFKKFLSHFVNQSFVLIDSKKERDDNSFNLNPFDINNSLSLILNLKNSLYFNRGKQRYSTIYTYLDTRNRTSFTFDSQENSLQSHQLQFIHKVGKFWLFDIKGVSTKNESFSTNFTSRNFLLENYTVNPKVSYVYSRNSRFEVFYNFKSKENKLGDLETLESQNIGINFFAANKQKLSLNANATIFFNDFSGDQNSPVAFQMLEGLQPGTNYTWNLNFQHKITSYLDINLNYLGRKSPTSKTVHTGTIQLRATF